MGETDHSWMVTEVGVGGTHHSRMIMEVGWVGLSNNILT